MSLDRDGLVSLIKTRLRRLNTTNLDAEIVTEIQYVQASVLELAEFQPWFMQKVDSTLTTAAAATTLALPADYISEAEKGFLWVLNPADSLWDEVTKDDYDALVNNSDYDTAAITKKYAIVGDTVYLFPACDIGYTYRMVYNYMQTTLTLGTSTNNWTLYALEWFVNEVAANIAEFYLKSMDVAKSFRAAASNGKKMLYTLHESKEHTNRDYKMGDD